MFLTKKSSDKSKSHIKNIVTVNAYRDVKYFYKNDVLRVLNKLNYNTSNFITSYLGNKDLITTTVTLSRNIPEEDISDILDIKAYEELGLDHATEYNIAFSEIENSTEEREFHIFVAEPQLLGKLFSSVTTQTKYIDLLIPAPLLYKTLYHREILVNRGVQCFMYFTMYDAFVTLYKDGEYLYSKSIEFSLEQIYDKYCEIIGEKIDEKEFFTMLESEGLKTTNSDYQENFMKIFTEVFSTINDIIIYAKRAFQLENIDQIYLGSVNGPIIGLDEFSQNYLELQSADLNFNYTINNNEWYTDQLQYMMLLSSLDYMENEDKLVNLTMFTRPPSFTNRAGGQFLIALFASISIGLAIPLYYLITSYIDDVKVHVLQNENEKLQIERDKYTKILGGKKKKISILDEKIDKLSNKYNAKSKTLTEIYTKKVNYRLKSATYHLIAEELSKFDVNVEKLSSKDDTLSISLLSTSDRKLTELIKYISETHFNDIKLIDIKRIKKDPESNYYKGLLKVDLK